MQQQNKLKESFLQFFHDLFDLMVVNWLWLLCSLPVVTAGPATCGLYTVSLKLARQEPVNPVKDFFRGFCTNFKSGMILGLAVTVLLVVAAGDIWFALETGTSLFLVVGIIVSAVFLILTGYAFALQAMFRNPLKTQMLNAFKLAAGFPAKTILMWLILLIPVLAALLLPPVALKMLGFLYLVAGISGPVYGTSHILRDIFDCVNGAPIGAVLPASEE